MFCIESSCSSPFYYFVRFDLISIVITDIYSIVSTDIYSKAKHIYFPS